VRLQRALWKDWRGDDGDNDDSHGSQKRRGAGRKSDPAPRNRLQDGPHSAYVNAYGDPPPGVRAPRYAFSSCRYGMLAFINSRSISTK
jgi:hypothetical protein